MKHGDFTALAKYYAQYRPSYSPFVLDAFLGLSPIALSDAHCVDAGAGTGIWSRQMASQGVRVDAVEPNEAMREEGAMQNNGLPITWHGGSAEHTGLPSDSYHLASMASSFHWPDFDQAVTEFDRLLVRGGVFIALWNTRRYESNPMLLEIENFLNKLVPDMKRVSSGRSQFCDSLSERLRGCAFFEDVIYVEGRHTELQTPEHYVGLWESVNDVRVQAGEERFAEFILHIRQCTRGLLHIEAEYTTRAWIARKR